MLQVVDNVVISKLDLEIAQGSYGVVTSQGDVIAVGYDLYLHVPVEGRAVDISSYDVHQALGEFLLAHQ